MTYPQIFRFSLIRSFIQHQSSHDFDGETSKTEHLLLNRGKTSVLCQGYAELLFASGGAIKCLFGN